MIEKLEEFIKVNVAAMDCVASCPDEVAIAVKEGKGNIRTDAYCDECFTRQILTLISSDIEQEEAPFYYSDQQREGFNMSKKRILSLLKNGKATQEITNPGNSGKPLSKTGGEKRSDYLGHGKAPNNARKPSKSAT